MGILCRCELIKIFAKQYGLCYNIGMLEYADIFCNIQNLLSYCYTHGVQLVLASKTIDRETLQHVAKDFPSIVFGENRVQELCDKYFDAHWIFIGRLQRNKVKYLTDKVEMICSVDSLDLAQEIEKQCAKKDRIMPVLLELNLGEAQKGGIAQNDLLSLAAKVVQMPHLKLEGMMAVLPIDGAEEAAHQAKIAYDSLHLQYPDAAVFSMGMTADYALAVQNGSTMIRIGSAVFGKRS